MDIALVAIAAAVVLIVLAAGAVATLLVGRRLAAQLSEQAAADRDAAVKAAIDNVIAVAGQSLGEKQAAATAELEAKKGLIDQQLSAMGGQLTSQLERVQQLMGDLERDRVQKFGELESQLRSTAAVTANLTESTQHLREALASPKARGQWGERMAEDVLRLAGFVEGINYRKQATLEAGGRPDFTFTLPRGYVVHMDAKFPISSYLRFLEAEGDADREAHRSQFLRDVRSRVKELAKRDYSDDADGGTVDYVLLFIPNESIYGFIHEADTSLLDDALRQKVVPCSPLSLFAVLAVIRQAFDNFVIEQTSDEILAIMGAFATQYGKFCEQLDKLGRGLQTVEKAYDDLSGTRRRALERPLAKIEELRQERGIDVAGGHGLAGLELAGLEIAELPIERAG